MVDHLLIQAIEHKSKDKGMGKSMVMESDRAWHQFFVNRAMMMRLQLTNVLISSATIVNCGC